MSRDEGRKVAFREPAGWTHRPEASRFLILGTDGLAEVNIRAKLGCYFLRL